MPKKKVPKKPVYQRPMAFPVYVYEPLELKEREQLRKIVVDPVFQKAIRNAHARKPDVNPPNSGIYVNEHTLQIATNRLHQIQGWEMFEAALFRQAEEAIAPRFVPLKETYPTENL